MEKEGRGDMDCRDWGYSGKGIALRDGLMRNL